MCSKCANVNIEEFRNHCLSKSGVSEGFPFDEFTLVFKVLGKMSALTGVDNLEYINLKCDPERAIELRENYDGVRPGYHMNKKRWNSVYTQIDINEQLLYELRDYSFDLLVKSPPKRLQNEL